MKLPDLSSAISQTHIALQSNAIKAINRNLTLRNWLIGFYIVEFEQKGEDRAQYGTNLLKTLEKQVNTRGLTETLFKLSRQFYITYPQIKDIITDQLNAISATLSQDSVISSIRATLSHKLQPLSPICPTLSDELQSAGNQTLTFPPEKLIAHLSFSHIAELLPIADPLKRLFYETEAIKCNWSVRELRRQIATQLYERCGMSLNPSKLIAALQNNNPQPADIIKHPFTFEFLGLKAKDTVEETDLEQALIDHLQEFLLELGYGFCFEARQKRIIIDDRYYFADLVFYHRILHCHVIIELKNDEFRHEHLGQLNTYVSYYRDTQMAPGDNPPIGILLCTGAGPKMVEYATASLDTQLFVSKYLIELPQPQQLAEFIQREIKTLKK
ncbi:PDDEXK nuclease domain-containing protein [Gabonibacter chumensis]|uniref:PDDEXK nuclease domain-containing protein n=1 Tax=Gabonibacter chumensis TaxID=2972474 RepID=UPI0025743EB0|nr:PDDEXK nuclease domain-containing protein [Gabonibacter chumensis]MCR9011037.1 PDDEXK nuclease domain-containing protein [Gabonibacter chumensis]